MKTTSIIALGLVAPAVAFAPNQAGRQTTELGIFGNFGKKSEAPAPAKAAPAGKTLSDRIFGMDLFEPVKTQNDYGARGKKVLTQGKITSGSYVPNGLSATEFQAIRDRDAKKKAANYERNVKKAGIFTDYTEWYKKRGTDTNAAWSKSVTLGHEMAKTKYDWSGKTDQNRAYRGKK